LAYLIKRGVVFFKFSFFFSIVFSLLSSLPVAIIRVITTRLRTSAPALSEAAARECVAVPVTELVAAVVDTANGPTTGSFGLLLGPYCTGFANFKTMNGDEAVLCGGLQLNVDGKLVTCINDGPMLENNSRHLVRVRARATLRFMMIRVVDYLLATSRGLRPLLNAVILGSYGSLLYGLVPTGPVMSVRGTIRMLGVSNAVGLVHGLGHLGLP
jgi:hypothetical protein